MSENTRGTIQRRSGRCPSHGLVDATRTLPPLRFPIFVSGVRRLIAMTGAYECPRCRARTTKP
jgi:hypothetical protein